MDSFSRCCGVFMGMGGRPVGSLPDRHSSPPLRECIPLPQRKSSVDSVECQGRGAWAHVEGMHTRHRTNEARTKLTRRAGGGGKREAQEEEMENKHVLVHPQANNNPPARSPPQVGHGTRCNTQPLPDHDARLLTHADPRFDTHDQAPMADNHTGTTAQALAPSTHKAFQCLTLQRAARFIFWGLG